MPRGDKHNPREQRITSARRRHLPGFIIIGTQRGGTTSLYHYLIEHPQVGAAKRKEIHFFDLHFDKGIEWYRAYFPKRDQFSITGEATPYYLFHPEAAQRIHMFVPRVKCIALLRNPIDRAYSQYHMETARGLEPLSFADAIDHEPTRLNVSDDPTHPAWRHHSYLARGAYAEQLRRWLAVFPSDQLLILQSEELFREPRRILHMTQEFLEIERYDPEKFAVFHDSDYPAMDPVVRRTLRDYFAPLNRQLYQLVGHDFGWEQHPS